MCIGAVDGKHIAIQRPFNASSVYYNYKQRDSIILMAVVDASYKFVIVDIGQPGSQSDGGIWDSSPFNRALSTGRS